MPDKFRIVLYLIHQQKRGQIVYEFLEVTCNIKFHNFPALGLPSVIKQSANHMKTHILAEDGKFIYGATSRFMKSLCFKEKLPLKRILQY